MRGVEHSRYLREHHLEEQFNAPSTISYSSRSVHKGIVSANPIPIAIANSGRDGGNGGGCGGSSDNAAGGLRARERIENDNDNENENYESSATKTKNNKKKQPQAGRGYGNSKLKNGSTVLVHSLKSKPQWTGCVGTVLKWCEQAQRYEVRVRIGKAVTKDVALKSENVEPCPRHQQVPRGSLHECESLPYFAKHSVDPSTLKRWQQTPSSSSADASSESALASVSAPRAAVKRPVTDQFIAALPAQMRKNWNRDELDRVPKGPVSTMQAIYGGIPPLSRYDAVHGPDDCQWLLTVIRLLNNWECGNHRLPSIPSIPSSIPSSHHSISSSSRQ